VSVEARKLVHLYLSTDQETLDSGTCGQRHWNVRERHHAWSAVLAEWIPFLVQTTSHYSITVRQTVREMHIR
jgi:hypothetical protein